MNDNGSGSSACRMPSNEKSPDHFAPALQRFFRRRVSQDEVDDLVQDVFLNLHARGRTEDISNIEAYLFTIARHVLARHWRAQGRAPQKAALDDSIYSIADHSPSAERQMLQQERLSISLKVIE